MGCLPPIAVCRGDGAPTAVCPNFRQQKTHARGAGVPVGRRGGQRPPQWARTRSSRWAGKLPSAQDVCCGLATHPGTQQAAHRPTGHAVSVRPPVSASHGPAKAGAGPVPGSPHWGCPTNRSGRPVSPCRWHLAEDGCCVGEAIEGTDRLFLSGHPNM